MGVISTRSLGQPSHKIEIIGSVQAQCIAIEQVRNDGVVSVGSELIGHQLAVLPDTDDIWEEENGCVLVNCLAFRFSNVGFDTSSNFDGRSCRLASVFASIVSSMSMRGDPDVLVLDTDGAAGGWWIGCHFGLLVDAQTKSEYRTKMRNQLKRE